MSKAYAEDITRQLPEPLRSTWLTPANKTVTVADGNTVIIHYTTAPCTITCLDSKKLQYTGILTFNVVDLKTDHLIIGWPDLTSTFYQLFIDLIQIVHALHIAHNNTPAPMHTDRSTPVDNLCSLSLRPTQLPLNQIGETDVRPYTRCCARDARILPSPRVLPLCVYGRKYNSVVGRP